MDSNNQIKVKMSTTIAFIAIAILILIFIVVAFFYRNSNSSGGNDISSSSNSTNVTTHQNENSNNNSTNVATKQNESSTSNNTYDFSLNFLKLENNKKNMLYSPLSINYALSMLNEGASGNTKKQIESVLNNSTLSKYNNIENVLSLANGLYIRDSFSSNMKEKYTNTLLNKYNAEINFDSFESASNINNWIENKTFGQIKNMLNDASVQNPDTQMLLINALAIDMDWKNPFDTNNTNGENFYLDDGSTIQATMMNKNLKNSNSSYYKDENITALSMDLEEYENNQFEFLAIMPNSNLQNYLQNFTEADLKTITDKMTLTSNTENGLDVTIPKFSYDYNLNLKSDLQTMGIVDAFDSSTADFSNMANSKLYVSDALHKANIDFTEKGVKAAAVTVLQMNLTSLLVPSQKIEIKFDKPFMYIIRDKKTNEIWFVGTIYEPNSWEKDRVDYEK